MFQIRFRRLFLFALLPLLACAQDKPDPFDSIAWVQGPGTGKLGSQAEMKIPEGYRFADSQGAKKFLELTENTPTGREMGLLINTKTKWWAVFEFDETGYVSDEEKSSLDAAAMLKSIQEGTEAGNKERKRRGWSTLTVTGWVQPPNYSSETHNLEWATKAKDNETNRFSVNHNTRYLGRRGVMSVTLVTGPEELASTLPEFRNAMGSFSYTPENSYKAFVKGDKVAEYGLTALVVGGATAAAAKTGLLKSLWKVIVAAVVGLGALVKKFFSGNKQEPAQES